MLIQIERFERMSMPSARLRGLCRQVFEENLQRVGRMVALLDHWDQPAYLSRRRCGHGVARIIVASGETGNHHAQHQAGDRSDPMVGAAAWREMHPVASSVALLLDVWVSLVMQEFC